MPLLSRSSKGGQNRTDFDHASIELDLVKGENRAEFDHASVELDLVKGDKTGRILILPLLSEI